MKLGQNGMSVPPWICSTRRPATDPHVWVWRKTGTHALRQTFLDSVCHSTPEDDLAVQYLIHPRSPVRLVCA
ncbi:hypothetical protein IG631_13227 [Alternaria alternata]|nr:hypothetical protein IG631_13227 [Alternaria alternata]